MKPIKCSVCVFNVGEICTRHPPTFVPMGTHVADPQDVNPKNAYMVFGEWQQAPLPASKQCGDGSLDFANR